MGGKAFTTCLWFDDQAEEAARFYAEVFKDSRIGDIHRYTEAGPGTAGSVMLVEFELNGQKFVGLNGGKQDFAFNESMSVVVPCADQAEVDYYWNALLGGGGQEIACGWLKDRYGLCWQIVPEVWQAMIKDPDEGRRSRVMRAMLSMTKFDIATLERAYAGD